MELLSFAKEVVQNVAEQAASYKLGQSALRHLDRALWVVEKCARWAVPPPLDQDERPQPELVRPLPWPLFLALLITLRVTRESISLLKLVLGKPPVRSADVVMYIQSKRRYLRTLKYQGNRTIRARSDPARAAQRQPWYSGLQTLFEFTMCFKRQSLNYGNNNTTSVSNNDEVLVVKRSKRVREPAAPAASTSSPTDSPMERLIEKMMVDLDADSDDDSSFTLTNATSLRSDGSDDSDSDDYTLRNHVDTPNSKDTLLEDTNNVFSVISSSTPEADVSEQNSMPEIEVSERNSAPEKIESEQKFDEANFTETSDNKSNGNTFTQDSTPEKVVSENKADESNTTEITMRKDTESRDSNTTEQNNVEASRMGQKDTLKVDDAALKQPSKSKNQSPKEDTKSFLQGERCSPQKNQQQSKNAKIANGRSSAPNKKKGLQTQRRDAGVPAVRASPADDVL